MGSSDLLRTIRSGGGTAVSAAREFLRLAGQGAVSPSEIREVQRLVRSPELADTFSGLISEFNALTGQGEVFRDVTSLTPDTAQLTDARAMAERFLADLTLVEQPLLHHPGMTAAQKATRLFAFFEAYAARFGQLAHGAAQAEQAAAPALPPAPQGLVPTVDTAHTLAPPLTEAEFHKALAQFDKALQKAGFGALQTADGRSGLTAARQMLEARTSAELAAARPERAEAPGWKDNPRAVAADGRRPVDLGTSAPVPLTRRASPPAAQEESQPRTRERRSGQVLGSRMVWNVLHLLRDDDLTDVERRDAMNQLIVAAGLVLIFVGVVVGVLVLL